MGRFTAADWARLHADLERQGFALSPRLLSSAECDATAALFDRDELFRSTITMESHGYGRGRYRYFAEPLPPLIAELRRDAYAGLAPLANRWAIDLGREQRFPATHPEFLEHCHAHEQKRPTPLLLRYGAGDFNRLHQDVYGPVAFPLQMLVVLSQAGVDYDGGEVILLEQRPRLQSRAIAIAPNRGDALFFPNRERPGQGKRGFHRLAMRHGASEIRRGQRIVLGVIFHDGA